MKTYKEYKSCISDEETFIKAIGEARKEYGIETKYHDIESIYTKELIPFNLEREYFDLLVSQARYIEAKNLLKKMDNSYREIDFQNFIEGWGYRLNDILHANKNIENKILEAKKEFNQYTILIITVVVGVITIFASANNNLKPNNFEEGFVTFITISGSIIALVLAASFLNYIGSKNNKN